MSISADAAMQLISELSTGIFELADDLGPSPFDPSALDLGSMEDGIKLHGSVIQLDGTTNELGESLVGFLLVAANSPPASAPAKNLHEPKVSLFPSPKQARSLFVSPDDAAHVTPPALTVA